MLSEAYLEYRNQGPFPMTIDPWAETGRYFKQIHINFLTSLVDQMQPELERRGYIIARETSLQIAAGREPDLAIQRAMTGYPLQLKTDYQLIADELLVEAGVQLDVEIELQALQITHLASSELVTVIELVSPSNKDVPTDIDHYRDRREKLILEQGVQVVEFDFTRSIKRLVKHRYALSYAYHIAVFVPGSNPFLIGIPYASRLPSMALPLRAEGIRLDLHNAYRDAYNRGGIAAQMLFEGQYTEDKLPFPSLLTEEQRTAALIAVADWKAELERLQQESS
jgi:hypothetical protein